MKTACPVCGKPVIQRVHVERPGDAALFVETYACGEVRLWGVLDAPARPWGVLDAPARPRLRVGRHE